MNRRLSTAEIALNSTKKIAAMMLALAMTLSMVGCGEAVKESPVDTEEFPKGFITDQEIQEREAEKEQAGHDNQELDTPVEEAPPEAVITATDLFTEEEVENMPLFLGKTTNGVYQNKVLELGCELDETWTTATEEDRTMSNGFNVDELTEDGLKMALAESYLLLDMGAYAEEGKKNIDVRFENLKMLYEPLLPDIAPDIESLDELTEDLFAEIIAGNAEYSLGQMGAKNVKVKTIVVPIGNKEWHAIQVQADTPNEDGTVFTTMYQIQAYLRVGAFMASVTATSYEDDSTEEMLSMFETVKTISASATIG